MSGVCGIEDYEKRRTYNALLLLGTRVNINKSKLKNLENNQLT